jgi:serine/threonine-protein kinase
MNCPNCNAQVAPGAPFCPECGTRLSAVAAPLRVLQGRYELQKKLGQGGMGSVYLADDRRLSTVRWAVKEMSDAQLASPLERQSASDAFKHEAELLARLNHPNLPRVTDHFSEDGKNYLVMELVPGQTLLDYVQRSGLPRPPAEALGLAGQICDVLSYLHRQQPPVIFRDLKPANVMITPEGQLKLVDFGIARIFKQGQAKDTQAYGTVGYSAPEQYGRGQTDARSDIYSLGALLHQLLTGHDPAATPFRLPPASQLNPAVPAHISAALTRATDNDPEQRFDSVDAFRQALLDADGLVQRQGSGHAAALAATGATLPVNPGAPPYPQPGSQPYQQAYPTAGSQPSGAIARTTTGLAAAAFWLGVVSAALMALSLAVVAAGAAAGDPENTVSALGALLAFPPLLLGPLAAILGVIALVSKETAGTLKGRRHATVGVAAGVGALLLCCAVFAVFPSTSSTNSEGADAGSPALISAVAPGAGHAVGEADYRP